MVYETILKGLSKGSLDRFKAIVFTSDGKREFYSDFYRMLGFLRGFAYVYVVVFRHGKYHAHMIIKDCSLYKHQLQSVWEMIHGCPKFSMSVVKDIENIAIYFSTQQDIEFVDMSGGWLNE